MTPHPFDTAAAPATPPNTDNRKALLLALLVHALLLAVLIFNLNWRTETPGPVEVLWANGNSPVSPPPTPEPPKPQPQPKPQPEPEPQKQPDPPRLRPNPRSSRPSRKSTLRSRCSQEEA